MDCPSDVTLRSLLGEVSQKTSSTEVISHLASCNGCQQRIAAWEQSPRLNEVLSAANNNGIICQLPEPDPAGGSDALTNAYGLTPLRVIGQYELLRFIGQGGGGEVFEARHALLHRRVAVKLLSHNHCEDAVIRQRFFREMESIGQLEHPNIVHAYDAGEVEGTLYLAMELVQGQNLEAVAQRVGPMAVSEACEIIRQAALGLQHIFERGLVHRDLKPSNLLISPSGVKIADLGLALLHPNEVIDERLTGEHAVLGTVDYMAPEQAEESHEVDIRADLYGLGCTLFRLLVGRPPFADRATSTAMKKMVAHASAPIPNVLLLRPDVPPELAGIITKLMAKNRNDRYSKPQELVAALAPFCQPLEIASLMVVGGKPANGGRNTTVLEPSAESSAAPAVTTIQPQSNPSRFSKLPIVAGLAGLMLVVAWWGNLLPVRTPDNKTPTPFPKTEVATAGIAPVVPAPVIVQRQPAEQPPNAAPPMEPSPLEQLWLKEFQVLPKDLPWAGRVGRGTVRLEDDLGALVVNANSSVRLAKLGELGVDDFDVRLGMDFKMLSVSGTFGFFFGFREVLDDPMVVARFQAVDVIWTAEIGEIRRVVVRRTIISIADNGSANGERNVSVSMPIPRNLTTVRLNVQLKGDLVIAVSLNDTHCDRLFADEANVQIKADEYRGAFGLCVDKAAVEIRNPTFNRTK